MIETDKKTQRQAEFTKEHTLTEQDLRKLIEEKFERARMYYEALRKRETALQQSYR